MAWFAALIPAVMSMVGGAGDREVGLEQSFSMARQTVREEDAVLTEEKDFRDREKRMLATGRVALALQGTTDEGSPLLLASDLASEIEEQAMRIRHGGELKVRRMTEQTSLMIDAADRAAEQGAMRAGGSLLQGAGSAYGGMSSGGGTSGYGDGTMYEGSDPNWG